MSWKKSDLLFAPLGGSNEIGMNANLYHYDDQWVLVDLGISFPDDTMTGIDVILPDLSFIKERKDQLVGLVVTHGHEDHLGAIPYLWDELRCPIYGTLFTINLLKAKFVEHNLGRKIDLRVIDYNTPTEIGAFTFEAISVTHSIPQSAGLVISAGGQVVYHTGDWKFDEAPQIGDLSDMSRLKRLGDERVLAMVGDSTNAMVDGRTGSEADAKNGLIEVIAAQKNRVAVTCFASNVARVNSLVHAADAVGRVPMLVGRALDRLTEVARKCGYLKDWPEIAPPDEFDLIPRDEILLICTGSQGESRSAMTRIAGGDHHQVRLEENDTAIFSSREIPGNERAISRVHDRFLRRKIKVITADDAAVHVSGHPARQDMIDMYQMIKPQIAIPVHGTARYLASHAELAQSCQVGDVVIPENGQIIRLHPGPVEVVDHAFTGLLTVEGGHIVSLDSAAIRARRKMLWNGTVTAGIVLGARGTLCMAPSISQSGLLDGTFASDYIAEGGLRVEECLEDMPRKKRYSDDAIIGEVSRTLRELAREIADKRPIVHVHVMRMDGYDQAG